MKKWIIGSVLLVLLVIGGVIVMSFQAYMKDQLEMQYDMVVISEFKRPISFDIYDLNAFDQYDFIHERVYEKSIEEIQKKLLNGEFSTVELCKYYLKRIEKYQSFNAVNQINPNVLDQAAQVDQKIANGNTGALFGVVVLIKDNIASVDMNTSAGAYPLKDLTTKRNATVTQALIDQDAIILGKANLSEWSNFMSSPSSNGFSVLGGQTKHAYGKFDVGGSSSGSSVAAALSLSTVTIGTETAGSLIYPAGQNSVVALKPTMGLLSRDLIVPIAEAQDSAGVIARSVSDLEKVFHHILLEDANDPASLIVNDYNKTVNLDQNALNGKTLGLYNTGSEEVTQIVKEFEAAGAKVIEIELDPSAYEVDMMSVLNHGIVHDVDVFLANDAVKSHFKSMKEILAFYEENQDKAPYGYALLEGGFAFEGDVDLIIENNLKLTRGALDKTLENVDAIISISNELSGVYAPAGYPAITVPSGYKESGEPFGVTLVGGYLEDQMLIEIAYAYEVNTKHRKPPTE